MFNAFISGDNGFIASHLVKALKEMGVNVSGWDIKYGKDIRDITPEDLKGIDVVFHLAAMPKVPLSVEQPEYTHEHNVNATLRLLECAKQAGVKRFVYSASSSAYGEQSSLPLKEDMTPNPMSPYAVQKLVGEHYCKVYHDLYGIETISLRYFNVYGEDMPLENAYSACLAIFMGNKKEGKPLTVFGGKQTRDFTYVGDVVNANILAALSLKVGHGEVINIGGGDNHSIDEIAETISDNIVHSPQRKGEPMDTLADISRAKELLNWSPKTKLIEWLKINS